MRTTVRRTPHRPLRPALPVGRLIAGLVGLVLLAAACGNDAGAPQPSATGSGGVVEALPGDPSNEQGTRTADASSGEAMPELPPTRSEGRPLLQPVAFLPNAIAIAQRPGSTSIVAATQTGELFEVIQRDDGLFEPDPQRILNLTDQTRMNRERGLLGITFSPDGDELYVAFTDTAEDSVVAEFSVSGTDGALTIDPDSQRTVFTQTQPAGNHNGGHVAFGPDGYLYIGLGDGGGADDAFDTGQDPFSLLGTIVRIDPTASDAGSYGIPPDNPFADGAAAAPEVWSLGLRNPWRFSFDAANGDLWIGDVGQDEIEEIDWSPASQGSGRAVNFGWPLFEGNAEFRNDVEAATGSLVGPVFETPHENGQVCSITGGYVYRGAALPSLDGAYLYADYCGGEVMVLRIDDQGVVTEDRPLEVSVDANTLVSFGQDQNGEVYVISSAGLIARIDPQ